MTLVIGINVTIAIVPFNLFNIDLVIAAAAGKGFALLILE